MNRPVPALISNEYRTSSLSIPSVEVEMLEQLGGGDDPLDILIRLEEPYGTVTDEDLETLPLR
jgi:hypothetical protein